MYKIAILSFYSGVVERGAETFAQEIGKRLANNNKVTIFQAGKVKLQKFKVIQVKTINAKPKSPSGFLGKFYLDWQSFKILIFTIKATPKILLGKFDLVIPLNGGWQTVLTRLITKITGSKMLISGQAGIGSDDAANLFFRPDVFVALTTAQKQWAKKLVPELMTVLIPNGVDLSRFHPKVMPKKISLERPIAVCVSALEPYKRVDLTIKAVAKAKNLSLLVLGDGEMRGSIDALGKRLLGKRYLRIVAPHDEIPSYYRSADIFTLASKTEAFGISYAEAMACNLPAVTTNDNSREEIIGQAGILTNPVDVNQYAKDLIIATKTNYKNIPYMQAVKFSWNKIADTYQKLIEEILQS